MLARFVNKALKRWPAEPGESRSAMAQATDAGEPRGLAGLAEGPNLGNTGLLVRRLSRRVLARHRTMPQVVGTRRSREMSAMARPRRQAMGRLHSLPTGHSDLTWQPMSLAGMGRALSPRLKYAASQPVNEEVKPDLVLPSPVQSSSPEEFVGSEQYVSISQTGGGTPKSLGKRGPLQPSQQSPPGKPRASSAKTRRTSRTAGVRAVVSGAVIRKKASGLMQSLRARRRKTPAPVETPLTQRSDQPNSSALPKPPETSTTPKPVVTPVSRWLPGPAQAQPPGAPPQREAGSNLEGAEAGESPSTGTPTPKPVITPVSGWLPVPAQAQPVWTPPQRKAGTNLEGSHSGESPSTSAPTPEPGPGVLRSILPSVSRLHRSPLRTRTTTQMAASGLSDQASTQESPASSVPQVVRPVEATTARRPATIGRTDGSQLVRATRQTRAFPAARQMPASPIPVKGTEEPKELLVKTYASREATSQPVVVPERSPLETKLEEPVNERSSTQAHQPSSHRQSEDSIPTGEVTPKGRGVSAPVRRSFISQRVLNLASVAHRPQALIARVRTLIPPRGERRRQSTAQSAEPGRQSTTLFRPAPAANQGAEAQSVPVRPADATSPDAVPTPSVHLAAKKTAVSASRPRSNVVNVNRVNESRSTQARKSGNRQLTEPSSSITPRGEPSLFDLLEEAQPAGAPEHLPLASPTRRASQSGLTSSGRFAENSSQKSPPSAPDRNRREVASHPKPNGRGAALVNPSAIAGFNPTVPAAGAVKSVSRTASPTPTAPAEPEEQEPKREFQAWEIEFLASKVYGYLKDRLVVERERHGRAGFTTWP